MNQSALPQPVAWLFVVVVGASTAAFGCGGSSEVQDDTEDSSTSEADTEPSSSGSTQSTSSTSGDSQSGSSSATTATTDDTASTTSTTMATSTSDSAGTGTTGAQGSGVCLQGCEEDADCCPVGAVGCPSEDYPDNYTCNEGICEFGGCADNDDCNLVVETQECHPIEGVGTCFEPCANDNDCLQGTCIGMADDDTMYCTTEPEPCESDDDCNGLCDVDTGSCYCESDSNCTDDTLDTCAM